MINRASAGIGDGESGAALVTVVLITFILLVACVAMLNAVGAGTRNSADVLAESKAYYAAESGLQATINVLRNTDTSGDGVPDGLDYKTAIADCDASSGTNICLGSYLSYCSTGDCDPARVVFANGGAAYDPNVHPAFRVEIADPDNTAASLSYTTVGGFIPQTGIEVSEDFRTLYIPELPEDSLVPYTKITFTGTSGTHDFTSNASLGTFQIEYHNGGVAVPAGMTIDFRIDYFLTAPRSAVRSIRGTLKPGTGTDVSVTFLSQLYDLLGSRIELCNGTSNDQEDLDDLCSPVAFTLSSTTTSKTVYANISQVEPFRLKVLSTGFGPNGAKKQLEAIVQKDYFNGLASGAATTMIGTNPGWDFLAGTSNPIEYNGCDSSGQYCVPSFGFTNPDNLDDALDYMEGMNGTMDPPPALLGSEIPGWQSSVGALDALVDQLRSAAQNSGRYFVNTQGPDANMTINFPAGSFSSGQGITFCEGSCKASQDGGGILVVTGKLTNVGGWSFKGMIIVTGEDGWLRTGGGNGHIIGNVVIAPYNLRDYVPENLSSTFLSPKYQITGGGASEITYSDISATFDGTSSISNIMAGVSEK